MPVHEIQYALRADLMLLRKYQSFPRAFVPKSGDYKGRRGIVDFTRFCGTGAVEATSGKEAIIRTGAPARACVSIRSKPVQYFVTRTARKNGDGSSARLVGW